MAADQSRAVRALTSPAAWSLVLFAAGAVTLTHNAWRTPTLTWAGGCCDPQQAMWYLRWAPYALGHRIDPFFTTYLNFPYGVNTMWNTPIFVAALVSAPITLIAGPVVDYNFLLTAGIALSGWCMCLALRRYTTSIVAALAGGAIYGFSPYVMQQAAFHLDLVLAFIPPLFLIALDELLIRRRHSPYVLGVLLGVLATVQFLTEEELLLTCVIFAAVVLLVLAWRRLDEVRALTRPVLQASAAAAVTFLVLCAWPLRVQFFGGQRVHGPLQDLDTFSTDLLNLVVPTHFQLIAPDSATALSSHFTGLDLEANAYIGLPLLLVLTALVARHWGDLRVRVAAVVAAAGFVLSLGPHLHIAGQSTGWPLPFLPFTYIPVVQDIQPNRLVIFMWLGVAGLVAIAIDGALRGDFWRHAAPRLAGVTASAVLILPGGLSTWDTDTPRFFHQLRAHGIPDGATALIAPFFRDGAGASPMLWVAEAGGGIRMPEAYAFIPNAEGKPMYGPISTTLTQTMESIQDNGTVVVLRGDARDQAAQDMRTLGVEYVIVGPMGNRQQMVSFFVDLLGRQPQEVDGVELWRDIPQQGVAPAPS